MYIMHIIELTNGENRDIIEVQGNSKSECIHTYLTYSTHDEPDYAVQLNDTTWLIGYKEEVCTLQSVTTEVMTAQWKNK